MGKLSLTKSPSVPDPGLSTYASSSAGGMSSSASVDTSIAASRLHLIIVLRGPGFNPYMGHCVVSLSKTYSLPRVLVNI